MARKSVTRCAWCLGTELMTEYHDREWGVPVHDDRKHFEFLVLDAFQAGQSDVPPDRHVTPDADVYQMYTSGTTGRPKGAVLTHAAVMAQLHQGMLGFGTQTGDRALIVAAGVPSGWLEAPGLSVGNLPTRYGELSFSVIRETPNIRVTLDGDVRIPPAGIVLRLPLAGPPAAVWLDGVPARAARDEAIVVRTLPAEILVQP